MEEPKKEQGTNKTEPAREKKKIIIETVAVTLAVALVAAGIIFAWLRIHESADRAADLQGQLDNLQKDPGKVQVTGESGDSVASGANQTQSSDVGGDIFSDSLPADSPGAAGGAQLSEYEDWKTYTNFEVGYSLRYPSDWSVKETSGVSEMFNEPVKYVTLYSPGKKYVLHWALKNEDDNFKISERTGIGVGEDKKDGTVNILGEDVFAVLHVYQGKTVEIFYPSPGTSKIDGGKWEIAATLNSDNGDRDLKNAAERTKAELILKSIRLIWRDQSNACGDAFSKEEILNMEGWKRLDNPDPKFTFLYPQEWIMNSFLGEAVANRDRSFQFRWGTLAQDDLSLYITKRTENIKFNCLTAKISYITPDPQANRVILGERNSGIAAQFEKNGKKYLVLYLYKDIGASISGDLIEQFKTILKTIDLS
jgi:hypothetical protein